MILFSFSGLTVCISPSWIFLHHQLSIGVQLHLEAILQHSICYFLYQQISPLALLHLWLCWYLWRRVCLPKIPSNNIRMHCFLIKAKSGRWECNLFSMKQLCWHASSLRIYAIWSQNIKLGVFVFLLFLISATLQFVSISICNSENKSSKIINYSIFNLYKCILKSQTSMVLTV